MTTQTINIKKTSGHQSIDLPEQFKINDDKVYIKKMGNALFIIPYHDGWQSMLDSLDKFTPDFMDVREQSPVEKRENLD